MGWKTVKEHYRIGHMVQVTEAGICIGSPYIHNIIVISFAGDILKEDDRTLNDELQRYQREMKADLGKLREAVAAQDTFTRSIPVFTFEGATIIEKQCEEPGWPNVTHDGLLMYENTFSTDRERVLEWAKRSCVARIKNTREHIADVEARLAEMNARLVEAEENAATLGIMPPSPQPNVRGNIRDVREALTDPTIASYPDFVAAVAALLDELEDRRARAPQSNVEGIEPDEWQYFCDGKWRYSTNPTYHRETGYPMRPLYAHPPAPQPRKRGST